MQDIIVDIEDAPTTLTMSTLYSYTNNPQSTLWATPYVYP